MKKHKLIVISFDAMIGEDLEALRAFPTFRGMLENGARVNRLRSIYPTLTYPCHTTMSTGCWPDKTGIINNEQQMIGVKALPWFWYHDAVLCEDIWDAAKAAGYSTASVGWPVTGRHPSVDYLVDEIWPYNEPYTAENFRKAYLASGTPQWLFDRAVAPHLHLRLPRTQPDSSYFLTKVSCEIIRAYRPDLLLIHVGNMDAYRHKAGISSPLIAPGLEECEAMLTELVAACQAAGVLDCTNFVITSDHGQIDTTDIAHPNVLFRQQGWITVDPTGAVTDWRVWCFPAGTSAQIVLQNPADEAFARQVYEFLSQYSQWQVLTRQEVRAEHLDGNFHFVLETDGHTQFAADWEGDFSVAVTQGIAGMHGHHPDKGPHPVFVGYGPAFRQGAILDHADLIDGAPTYAHILGIRLPQADGKAMTQLLAAQEECK